jgi:hypothetical protein
MHEHHRHQNSENLKGFLLLVPHHSSAHVHGKRTKDVEEQTVAPNDRFKHYKFVINEMFNVLIMKHVSNKRCGMKLQAQVCDYHLEAVNPSLSS